MSLDSVQGSLVACSADDDSCVYQYYHIPPILRRPRILHHKKIVACEIEEVGERSLCLVNRLEARAGFGKAVTLTLTLFLFAESREVAAFTIFCPSNRQCG